MSKSVRIDFLNKTIIVSKNFLKRAETPFSEEFAELTALQKEMPTFTMKVRKSSCQPKQFRPTYHQMVEFIRFQPMEDELMEEFQKAKAIGAIKGNAYMEALKWFRERFPELTNDRFEEWHEDKAA